MKGNYYALQIVNTNTLWVEQCF